VSEGSLSGRVAATCGTFWDIFDERNTGPTAEDSWPGRVQSALIDARNLPIRLPTQSTVNAIHIHHLAARLKRAGVPLLPKLLQHLIFLIYNSYVPSTAQIGRGTVFAYGGIGVVLHSDSRIGEDCVIGQGVTVGAAEAYASSSPPTRCPTIGDNVYIAAGARLLGGITIGSNVIIGASAVVLHDVPDGAIVAGVPARIIGRTEPGYRARRP